MSRAGVEVKYKREKTNKRASSLSRIFSRGGNIQFLIDIQHTHNIIFMLLNIYIHVVLCKQFGLWGGYEPHIPPVDTQPKRAIRNNITREWEI